MCLQRAARVFVVKRNPFRVYSQLNSLCFRHGTLDILGNSPF